MIAENRMAELGEWRHLCVDMQRMFLEETPWQVPWMAGVLPKVERVCQAYPQRTVFTRFIPPRRSEDARGAWRDYYGKWWMMTGEQLLPEMLDLAPSLQDLAPPARIFDKSVYSPWLGGGLAAALANEEVETLVVSGGETDVCVLATILGAIDLGFRIVVLRDAVCSGTDETHDAAVDLLAKRFSVQLVMVSSEDFLDQVSKIKSR